MDRIAYQEAPASFCSPRLHANRFIEHCDSLQSSCIDGSTLVIRYSLCGWVFFSEKSEPWRKEGREVQTLGFPGHKKGVCQGIMPRCRGLEIVIN